MRRSLRSISALELPGNLPDLQGFGENPFASPNDATAPLGTVREPWRLAASTEGRPDAGVGLGVADGRWGRTSGTYAQRLHGGGHLGELGRGRPLLLTGVGDDDGCRGCLFLGGRDGARSSPLTSGEAPDRVGKLGKRESPAAAPGVLGGRAQQRRTEAAGRTRPRRRSTIASNAP